LTTPIIQSKFDKIDNLDCTTLNMDKV